jgi:hypothetical protein
MAAVQVSVSTKGLHVAPSSGLGPLGAVNAWHSVLKTHLGPRVWRPSVPLATIFQEYNVAADSPLFVYQLPV